MLSRLINRFKSKNTSSTEVGIENIQIKSNSNCVWITDGVGNPLYLVYSIFSKNGVDYFTEESKLIGFTRKTKFGFINNGFVDIGYNLGQAKIIYNDFSGEDLTVDFEVNTISLLSRDTFLNIMDTKIDRVSATMFLERIKDCLESQPQFL